MNAAVKHPAKFSDAVLDVIRAQVELIQHRKGTPISVLDPFGGVGGVHMMQRNEIKTVCVEIEREWAEQAAELGETWCMDFFTIEPLFVETFDVVATSCTYGNRMADHHNAVERCRPCKGEGGGYVRTGANPDDIAHEQCAACGGTGYRVHKRMTYKHQLGRDLSPNNSAGMQWGRAYRIFHARAWARCHELLSDDGYMILNVSDHIRKKVVVEVAEWHRETLSAIGFQLVRDFHVSTPRMRFGKGAHDDGARVEYEHVMVFRK